MSKDNPVFVGKKAVKPGRVFFDIRERKTKSDPSVNIHNIIKRYKQTGQLPEFRQGQFDETGLLGNPPNMLGALDVIAKAEQYFETLPSDIRFKFRNDFAMFYQYAVDPKNADEMVNLGLASKSEKQVPFSDQVAEAIVKADDVKSKRVSKDVTPVDGKRS